MFSHGAGDGISARGGLSRQTVHRTVWSYGQIAMQFSPYFKSRQKQNKHNPEAVLILLVQVTGFEPTRISSLEPDGNVTSVETPVPVLSLFTSLL